eukprot:4603030-Heterocapsa_arctica.AAC.1
MKTCDDAPAALLSAHPPRAAQPPLQGRQARRQRAASPAAHWPQQWACPRNRRTASAHNRQAEPALRPSCPQ